MRIPGATWRLMQATARMFCILTVATSVSAFGQTQLDVLPIDDQFVVEGDVLVVPLTVQDISPSTFGGLVVNGLPPFGTFVDNGDGTGAITLVPGPGDGGMYQLFVSASDLELQQFDSEQFAVAVGFPGTVGTPLTIEISLAFPSRPGTSEIFFRRGGEITYQSTPLTQLSDTLFEGSIPATFATERGVEYYVQFFDEVVTTLPTTQPATRPAPLRIRFTNLPFAVALEAETYRMISVPAILDNPDPILTLADDLETPDPSSWRLLRWNPSSLTYDEEPALEAQFLPGIGFWIISATSASIDAGPGASTEVNSAQALVLEPGWNQIGSPFAFPVSWTDIDPDLTVETPVAFDGTEYQYDQLVLTPWSAYFVFNPQPIEVRLPVPPVEAGLQPQKRDRIPDVLYGLRISALTLDGRYRDTQNFVGFSEDATDGRDWADLSEAPPVGNHLRLSIMEGATRLARSYISPRLDGGLWDLDLSMSTPDDPLPIRKPIRIGLEEIGSRPPGFGVYLEDRESGERLAMSENEIATVDLSPREVRRYRLIVGTNEFAAGARRDGTAIKTNRLGPGYPNPFSEKTAIPYTLREAGFVRIDVFDVLGRHVQTLAKGNRSEGDHSVEWTGTDRSGRPVASGLYFCRLIVDGVQLQTPIVVSR